MQYFSDEYVLFYLFIFILPPDVFIFSYFFFFKLYSGHVYLLESCRDGDDFLDGAAQPLDVITPVEDLEQQT